jgi:hypothetical protein
MLLVIIRTAKSKMTRVATKIKMPGSMTFAVSPELAYAFVRLLIV